MYTINKYREYLLAHNYTVSKTNRICYSLESLLLDFSKILLILGIGLVTNSLPLVCSVLFPQLILRLFYGGVHCSTYWRCFFLLLALTLFGTFASQIPIIHHKVFITFTIVLCFIGTCLSPVRSPKKKVISPSLQIIFRTIGLIIQFGIGIIYILLESEVLKNGILVSLWIQHFQILILYFSQKTSI